MQYNEDSGVDPLQDNIGGQRSKFDVMAAILHIASEAVLKNHIIGRGNFSDAMANHYLSILLYHNLLEAKKDTTARVYYRTTERGREFIRSYNQIQSLFFRRAGSAADAAVMQSSNPGLDMSNAATVPLEPNAERKRILIVDDESDISSAMKIGLEDNGYTVDTFNDPLAALTNYKAGYYDLLLFDVRMPQMTGFELYRRIREADGKGNVCFLTAFEVYTEEFRKVFPSMDVKHFIQKPISMEDLVRKIKELT